MVEGKKYQFLVRACNDAGDSPDLENEEVITAKNPFDPPGKPLATHKKYYGWLQRLKKCLVRSPVFDEDSKSVTFPKRGWEI